MTFLASVGISYGDSGQITGAKRGFEELNLCMNQDVSKISKGLRRDEKDLKISDLGKKVDVLQDHLTEAELVITKKDKDIMKLESDVNALIEEKNNRQNQTIETHRNLGDRLEKLTHELQVSKEKIETVAKEKEAIEATVASFKAQCANQSDHITTLGNEIDSLQASKQKLQQERNGLQKAMSDLQRERDDAKMTMLRLEKEKNDLQCANDQLQNEKEVLERENNDWNLNSWWASPVKNQSPGGLSSRSALPACLTSASSSDQAQGAAASASDMQGALESALEAKSAAEKERDGALEANVAMEKEKANALHQADAAITAKDDALRQFDAATKAKEEVTKIMEAAAKAHETALGLAQAKNDHLETQVNELKEQLNEAKKKVATEDCN